MLGITGLDPHRLPDESIWGHIHKFGSNPALGGSSETIWSAGGLYPWSAFNTAQTLYVASDDAGDTGTVTIQGLDDNWTLITETVSLAGSPPQATTSNTFKRVFRMQYTDGAYAQNAGDITARTVSYAGTVVAQIDADKAQTLMAIYTIPDNYVGYLINYTVGVGKNDDAFLSLYTKHNGSESFSIKSELNVYQNTITQSFAVPLRMRARTDIDFRATGATTHSSCTVNFDVVLRKIERV